MNTAENLSASKKEVKAEEKKPFATESIQALSNPISVVEYIGDKLITAAVVTTVFMGAQALIAKIKSLRSREIVENSFEG